MKVRASSLKIGLYSTFLMLLLLASGVLVYDHDRSPGTAHSPNEAVAKPSQISGLQKARIAEAYGNLPLAFEKNVGQSDSAVQYLSHGTGYELFLTSHEAVLSLQQNVPSIPHILRTGGKAAIRGAMIGQKTAILRIKFEGANSSPNVTALQQLTGKANYFTGNDPKQWHTNVPTYAQVEYQQIYPGVDAVFYGNRRKLEYDFVVAPGSDPRKIVLDVDGVRQLRTDSLGNVVASIHGSEVELRKPVVYQEIAGERREVAAHYVLTGPHQVAFGISQFDRSQSLVIDPVLDYSTFLGGSSTAPGDSGFGIAVDASGDAYVTGTTFSSSFPTSNAIFSTPGAGIANGAAFVSEVNPTGTTLIYSTYLSGDTGEFGQGITVDTLGNAYVTGGTLSTNFPTTANAFSQSPITNPSGTGFLTKINPGGSTLLYSSLIGGTNGDFGLAVAADASGAGSTYVTGFTNSAAGAAPALFTLQGGFQTTLNPNGGGNAFLIRIDTTQTGASSLIYSSYLGGSSTGAGSAPFSDRGFGIAVDTAKSAYIVGATTATDFPTKNAFLSSAPTGIANGAVFVTKIDTTTTSAASLVYSTYLAGPLASPATNGDFGNAIALGPGNIAYITGQTTSNFYVTSGSYQSTAATPGLVFVSLIDTTKSGTPSVTYSATIGGTGGDSGNGIRVDSLGNAYVTGFAGSPNFPTTPGALQSARSPSSTVAFVLELAPVGNGSADLLYSTYFGGAALNAQTLGFAIGLDTLNNAYITGSTAATDFPVFSTGTPVQGTLTPGNIAAFVSKLTLVPTLAFGAPCVFDFTVAPASSCALGFGNQAVGTPSAAMTFTLTNNTSADITNLTIPPTGSGTNGTDFAATGTTVGANSPCTTILTAGSTCGVGVIFTPTISSAESGSLAISYNYNNGTATAASQSQSVELSGAGIVPSAIATVTPSTLTFTGELVTTTSAAQPVMVQNTGSAALNITATPVISGTNATDFAIASGSTCTNGASVAPGNSCVINVTFTPPANVTGTRSAVLSIADNATGSPQTVTLSGTAWDFTVSAQAITVTAGKNGTITATVTGLGGFTGAVSLACSTNIPQGSCMTPTSVNASAAGATASVTVITRGLIPAPLSPKTPPISRQQVLLAAFALALLMSLPLARRFRTRLSLAGAAAILVVVAGCSSPLPTPAGTYTVTITGSSNGLSRAATVNVTVQGH